MARKSLATGWKAKQRVHALVVHLHLQGINLLVVGDGLVGQLVVALEQGLERVAQVALSQAGHEQHVVT